MTRLEAERAFHDVQAARRRQALTPADLRFDDDDYLNHETWVRPAFEWLGDPRGKRILDLGCGHGMAAVTLARRGALVAGLDLSGGYLDEARARAEVNGVRADWVRADAERLPFDDASFDRVWAHAVLHHLDLRRSLAEIERVLKPGGWAIVCEPWGDNPLLRWARRRVAYPEKERTADEEPLRSECLPTIRARFPGYEWRGYQLAGMLRRISGASRWTGILDFWDDRLLTRIPLVRRLCRYAVFRLPRRHDADSAR